jgi:hypothetical protein
VRLILCTRPLSNKSKTTTQNSTIKLDYDEIKSTNRQYRRYDTFPESEWLFISRVHRRNLKNCLFSFQKRFQKSRACTVSAFWPE